jgi:peptide/nickel transport system substrate-binding protein
MFEKINNIEVVQDDVVMIKLSSKDPFLMKKLTYPIASILPKEVEEDFFADPVGTGPFRFKRWEKGEEIILHSNKEYFRERPFVDGVTFSIFKDEETALLEFETGWIDLLLLPQQEVRRFQQNIRWKDCIIQNKEKTVHLLLINETLPQNLFDAIKLAIDKRTIVDLFLKGTYHTTETPPPHKPEVAKELAKEASVRKELSLLVVDGAKMPLRIAKKVERDLFGIGLLLKMEKVNWSVFIKRIDAGRYDLAYTTFDSSFLYELYSKKRAIELFKLNTYIIHQPYLYNLKEDRSFEKVWLLR